MEAKYVLNHFYKLRHDLKRSYVLSPEFIDHKYSSFAQPNWTSRIHPILAMVLSFFSMPSLLSEIKKEISFFCNIQEEEADNLISLFINNRDNFRLKYEGIEFHFPKNIIITESDQFINPTLYTPKEFAYKELNFKQERFFIAPKTIVFMVNNTCATDCVYCYANKSIKSPLISFNKLQQIIKDARNLGIVQFTLVGGEIFLYKHWKELLHLLDNNGLKENIISTKVPIDEDNIRQLKDLDIGIQVSLDSVNSTILTKILNTKLDYCEKIKKTINLLDKYDIRFQISTVITKYNSTVDNLEQLFLFLNQFKNLRRWEIRIAFKSLYSRKDFDTIKITRDEIKKIDQKIKEIQKNSSINIQWTSEQEQKYLRGQNGSINFKGARCSANYSNMFILPDGKVSICEQLYWNPNFIIGDLTKQTIQEVWNSPKALALAFPKKEHISASSVCKSCEIYDECMAYPNRCIADILKAYGEENIDYPDPRCSKAPKFIYNILND